MIAFFAVFWTVGTCLANLVIVQSIARQVESERFVPTTATITQSEVRKGGSVDLRYRFVVDGRTFDGEIYRYSLSNFQNGPWARRVVQRHPTGAKVTVYYDQANPAQSLLKPGFGGAELFMIMFLTPFNAYMLASWIVAGGMLLRVWRGLPPTPELYRNGPVTRVRLPLIPSGAAGPAALGGTATAGLFLVILCEGIEASMSFMLLAWAVVLIAGAAFGFWLWWEERRGAFDLIIDERTVTLPERLGRFRRAVIERSSIRAVTVNKSRFPLYSGNRIQVERRDGQSITIVVWSVEEFAKQFAAQLNDAIVVAR